jgi:hypothetical protein
METGRQDRLGTQPSFGGRPVSLAKVSEAARALAASQAAVHVGRTVPNFGAGFSNWDFSIVPERNRLLDPNVLTAPLPVRRRCGFAVAGLAVFVLGVGSISVLTNARFPPVETWKQLAARIKLTSSEVPLRSAMQDESAMSRLIAQSSHALSGEPVPLGLAVHGTTGGAVVIVTGLLPGMELSTGDALRDNAWRVSASDLAYAWVAPPESFVGSADLVAELRLVDDKVADRQVLHIEWLSAISPEAAQHHFNLDPIVQLDREKPANVPPHSPPVTLETHQEIAEVPPISPKMIQRQLDHMTVEEGGNLRTWEGSPPSERVTKEVAAGVSSSEGLSQENSPNAARNQDHRGMAAQRYPWRSDGANIWIAPPDPKHNNRHAPSAARTPGRASAPKGFWNWSW